MVRHKAEKPLYIVCVIISMLLFFSIALFGFAVSCVDINLYIDMEALRVQNPNRFRLLKSLDIFGAFVIVPLVLILIGLLLRNYYKNYADTIPNCVKVTEKNFPELYIKSIEFSQKLGFKKVPSVYIGQHDGVLHTFASWLVGRSYIQLNAEIVDIAYMEERDFEAVAFIMAREFSHLYFKHSSLKYRLSILFANLIPILGASLARAREYSCDRAAQLLTSQDGLRAMSILTAGRHLYKYLDLEDYIDHLVNQDRGNLLERSSVFVGNLFSSQPITTYRFQALADPEKKSGRLF